MAPARQLATLIAPETRTNTAARIAINGFGRIGRNLLRASLLRPDIHIVAINHTCASVEDVMHLILFDSTHGPLPKTPSGSPDVYALDNQTISVQGHEVHLISERDVKKLDWTSFGADYIVESTGKFTSTKLAEMHITYAGAKRVLISAPSEDAPTFVYGVNLDSYSPTKTSRVISCASCTTNCLAPIAKVLDEKFGIEQGLMTTVHASTRSQHVLDGYSKRDKRSGRAVLGNIIPTTTGAAKAVSRVLPGLKGKLTGISLRVPTTDVSLVDLVLHLQRPTSLPAILEALREASQASLTDVLEVVDEELVSCDFLGNPYSAVVDSKACVELNPQFFKIVAWYDNEWAYASRMLDMLAFMAERDR